MRRVLVVAAHPDDEVLGCGGTMARHAEEGDIVRSVFLADGVGGRMQEIDPQAEAIRVTSACDAATILGTEKPIFLGLRDNRLDELALLDIVRMLEKVIFDFKPTIVYTHHGSDLNVDHRLAHQSVMTACRPQPDESVTTILTFETPSSTEWSSEDIGGPFNPNWFVDVSKTLGKKIKALNCYSDELRPFPHARSLDAIEALMRWRGATCGVNAAEAFVVVRRIVK